MTPAMREYVRLDAEIEKLEAEKETIRESVLKEFQDNPDTKFKGITHSVAQKVHIYKDKFFEWVKENWPDKLDRCRADIIDEEKFTKLHLSGEIEYDEIPPEVYSYKQVDTIRITSKRKKNGS